MQPLLEVADLFRAADPGGLLRIKRVPEGGGEIGGQVWDGTVRHGGARGSEPAGECVPRRAGEGPCRHYEPRQHERFL